MDQLESNIISLNGTHHNDAVDTAYSGFFGEGARERRDERRARREAEQVAQMKRLAEQSGLSEEEVEKSIKAKGGVNQEALADLLGKVAEFGTALTELRRDRGSRRGGVTDTTTYRGSDFPPAAQKRETRILGMKPLAFTGVTILTLGAIGFTIWRIRKATKGNK